jgi:hypothetical protein
MNATSIEFRGPFIAVNFEIVIDLDYVWLWTDSDNGRDDKTAHWTEYQYMIDNIDRVWSQGLIPNEAAMAARAAVFTHYEIWKNSVIQERATLWDRLAMLVTGARW